MASKTVPLEVDLSPEERFADIYDDEPCPTCGNKTLMHGFGLAFGGYGPWTVCDTEGCGYGTKTRERLDDVPNPDVP